MYITFSPIRAEAPLILERQGDILTLNGETFDLTPLSEGASLPAEATGSDFFVGEISRRAGMLHMTILLPHGQNPPQSTAFPEPILVEMDGRVALPPYDGEPE